MIEDILSDEKIRKRDIWDVLKDIEKEQGEDVFGKYSFFGMESLLQNYMQGRYNENVHNFYEKYKHYFVGCEDEDKLILSRHKFNKEIETGVIRYLK